MKKSAFNLLFLFSATFSLASCGGDNPEPKPENFYTITWKNDDGSTLSTTEVKEGETPVYDKGTPTKEPTVDITYTFDGWSPEIVKATCDTSYTATYKSSPREYEVTFDADDGYFDNDPNKHTKSIWVAYNSKPVFTETPKKKGDAEFSYSFEKWDHEFEKVKGNQIYKASYTPTKNKYTISWYNDVEETKLLHTEYFEYGATPSYHWEDKPTKPGTDRKKYDWNGWEEKIVSVTSDAKYHAHFDEVNKYLITYKNYDGTVLQESYVPSDILPTYEGAQPTRPPDAQYTYEPVGWDKDEVKPTCDTVYIYTYQPVVNKYKITWKGGINGDQVLDEKMVAYGKTPTAPDDVPETLTDDVYEYTFLTWSPTVVPVTGEATYVAQYKQSLKDEYTITWNNWDDTLLKKDTVTRGDTPSYAGTTPTKIINNHSFTWTGWDIDITPALKDITYTATFDGFITFDFVGTNCVINGKSEFTDLYNFNDQNPMQYVIAPINTYQLPDEVNVYVDDSKVGSDKYSYNKTSGEFSIATDLGNIRLEASGVRL